MVNTKGEKLPSLSHDISSALTTGSEYTKGNGEKGLPEREIAIRFLSVQNTTLPPAL